jgi:hypothetical protein
MLFPAFATIKISQYLFRALYKDFSLHFLTFHHLWPHRHQNLLALLIFIFFFLFLCRYPKIAKSYHCIMENIESGFRYPKCSLFANLILRNHHNFNEQHVYHKTILIFLNRRKTLIITNFHFKSFQYLIHYHFYHKNCKIQKLFVLKIP